MLQSICVVQERSVGFVLILVQQLLFTYVAIILRDGSCRTIPSCGDFPSPLPNKLHVRKVARSTFLALKVLIDAQGNANRPRQ